LEEGEKKKKEGKEKPLCLSFLTWNIDLQAQSNTWHPGPNTFSPNGGAMNE